MTKKGRTKGDLYARHALLAYVPLRGTCTCLGYLRASDGRSLYSIHGQIRAFFRLLPSHISRLTISDLSIEISVIEL